MFRLGFMWEISAWFPRWEKAKDARDEFWCQIWETKQTWQNTKISTFVPFVALAILKALSLQLNGTLWCGKYNRQCKAMPSGPLESILVTGLKCSCDKISSPLTEISGTEPPQPLIWIHQGFYSGFRGKVRSRKLGQPSQLGSCEKVIRQCLHFSSIKRKTEGVSAHWMRPKVRTSLSLFHVDVWKVLPPEYFFIGFRWIYMTVWLWLLVI